MAENKKFFDFFKHYSPNDEAREMLESAEEVRVRVAKDPLRIEILARFPRVVRNAELYPVEDELCALYSAASCRILPSFPSELFSVVHMEDIVGEAVRVGVIARGFFDHASYCDDGEELTITIPFLSDSIDFMNHSGTTDTLGNILRCRFSIDRRVRIASSENAAELVKQRESRQGEILAEYDAKALEQLREMMRTRKAEAEGGEAEEVSHADFERLFKLEAMIQLSIYFYKIRCFSEIRSRILRKHSDLRILYAFEMKCRFLFFLTKGFIWQKF